ncbi:MAG: serine/threonine protein kinase [Mycobacterium sp.]|nr:serine/threonine protein kinase [Mycobacterium sp.]
MSLADGQTFAGYTIVGVLGVGGMGEVYLAQHPRLPRQDALKVLGTGVSHDDEFRQRFNQEAEMVAGLRHRNIVTIYDRGDCDGRLWIAMEYVDGTDAGRLLLERYPRGIPPAEVVRIVTAVAEALDYAHSCGLLHRDIKPANILLGTPGHGDPRVLLADFGVARWLGQTSDLTGTDMTVGTVTYAAPEQLKGEAVDGQADQYALAATAYHLMTGSAPFVSTNPTVVISQHLSAPPPAVMAGHPELIRFAPVFGRALAKDPKDRFKKCGDFAAALKQALEGPVARPRRRWAAVGLGALMLGGAGVAAAVLLSQQHKAPPAPRRPGPPPAVSARMDLPVVVVGADCSVLGAAAVDATGAPAYCAHADNGAQVWASQPDRLRTVPDR